MTVQEIALLQLADSLSDEQLRLLAEATPHVLRPRWESRKLRVVFLQNVLWGWPMRRSEYGSIYYGTR